MVDDAGDAGGTGVQDPLDLLIQVQDLDLELARLEHRRAALPERRELVAAEAGLRQVDSQVADVEVRRRELLDRQGEMEAQVAALSARHRQLEDRLYSSRGSAARDLQALDAEIHQLARHRAEIEEAELAVMEEQEPLDAELARLADERAQLETVAGSLRAALAASDAVAQAEITNVEHARGVAAARLPTALLDHYEVLRARLGGVGAARLVGNRCDGCHLELPSAEVDRLRHQPPGTVVTCDQCGRILVRTSA